MGILDNITLELVFFIIFGAAIMVSGVSKLRERRRLRRHGGICEGTVLKSSHVSKRDDDGYLIQNYYDLRISYKENGHTKQADVKSIREFLPGDKVMIRKDRTTDDKVQLQAGDDPAADPYTPWFLIAMGFLTANLPIVNEEYGTTSGSGILAAIFLLLGLYFLLGYTRDRRRKTVAVPAEIEELLRWRTGKERSRLSKPVISYYPILKFEWNGAQRHMRSSYNFSSESACKAGSVRTLYYDDEHDCLLERGAKKSMLFWGCVFILIAVTGLVNVAYLMLV